MLRVRTGYSFRQAVGTIDEVISRLVETGAKYAPITDQTTYAFAEWNRKAIDAGLIPVFGAEIPVSADPSEGRPVSDDWLFFPRYDDLEGLNDLVSEATRHPRGPLLDMGSACQAAELNLLSVVIGHRPFFGEAREGRFPGAASEGSIYLGLSPATPRGLLVRGLQCGYEVAAVGVNRYPRATDAAFFETAIRKAPTQTYPQHILSPGEWADAMRLRGVEKVLIDKALANTEDILQKAAAVRLATSSLPDIPPSWPSLREACEQALVRLGDYVTSEYQDRLNRELAVIADKKFEKYFLIVADLVRWARERMLVGPARGSSCGSLVCYLLGITTVDPIRFGLLFERFIDPNRNDLPDIDIDFADTRRNEVFDYLRSLYGESAVARLGTVNFFGLKSALAEAGFSLKVPRWKCQQVGDAAETFEELKETAQGKALFAEQPAMMIAERLIEHPRHSGQHAAGVVIANRPISEIVAVDHQTGATMCDMRDAEGVFGMLKIDCLGLTQLSVLDDFLELADLDKSDLFRLDKSFGAHDPSTEKAFEVLRRGDFTGIFQFNGTALQRLAAQVPIDSFGDLVSLTALARPGPLQSGGAETWVRRRLGKEQVPDDVFATYCAETFGVVVYQEQVMKVLREIGGLDWGAVNRLRKIMGKSLGVEEFNKFGEQWFEGASRHLDEAEAWLVWDGLCKSGKYAFNKSHSVAYALVSYWCAWAKGNYPFEFAAATLSHERDDDRALQLLREIVAEGFHYTPIDRQRSHPDKWTVHRINGRETLVGPLRAIDGIGPEGAKAISHNRSKGYTLPETVGKKLERGATPFDSLWPIKEAFAKILPDPRTRSIYTEPTPIGEIEQQNTEISVLVFAVVDRIEEKSDNHPDAVRRRGYPVKGQARTVLFDCRDDTGTIRAKLPRWLYDANAPEFLSKARAGKSLFAVKGSLMGHGGDPSNAFRLLMVKGVRYIGELDRLEELALA